MHRSSYCGINCEKCKVYIGTMADNDELKQEIANEWSILYKRDFKKKIWFVQVANQTHYSHSVHYVI